MGEACSGEIAPLRGGSPRIANKSAALVLCILSFVLLDLKPYTREFLANRLSIVT